MENTYCSCINGSLSVSSYYVICVVLVVVAILIVLAFVLSGIRRIKLKQLREYFKSICDKNVFILQLGTDYVIMKTFNSLFDTQIESTTEKSKIENSKYDIIIVLNTLRKKEKYIFEINNLENITKEKTFIFDPFISKNFKRNYWAAWFGMPTNIKNTLTINEYVNILK